MSCPARLDQGGLSTQRIAHTQLTFTLCTSYHSASDEFMVGISVGVYSGRIVQLLARDVLELCHPLCCKWCLQFAWLVLSSHSRTHLTI